jgi:hypothetical protein
MLLISCAAIAAAGGLTLAQVFIPDPAAPELFVRAVLAAFEAGQHPYAAVLVLIGLVYVAARFGGKLWAPLDSRLGKSLLVVVGGALTGAAMAMASGNVDAKSIWEGVRIGAESAGFFRVVSILWEDALRPFLARKWPGLFPPALAVAPAPTELP